MAAVAWFFIIAPLRAGHPVRKEALCIVLAVATLDLVVTTIIFVVMKRGLATKPLTLDRRQMRLWQEGRKDDAGTPSGLDIRRVAAVQLCSGLVDEVEIPLTVYEMNLVFTRPRGERFRLVSHSNEAAIRSDARELARFLRVPLLDHTGREDQ